MDFILSYNNNEVNMVFPVVENEGIDLESPQSNGSFDSLNGEMNTIGTMGLRNCSIASIFPTHNYPWMRPRSSSDGWDYVRKIEAGRKRFIPFRAILLDNDGSEIFNMPCTVDKFTYKRDKAGDVAYTLELREYRFGSYVI